jgi:glucose-1-phosphate adenylyltransferase
MPGNKKMALASMGIYVFDWKWLSEQLLNRPHRHDFGHDIIPIALDENSLRVDCLPDRPDGSPGYWRDVGTLDAYLDAQIEFANPLTMPCRLPHRYPALNAGKVVGVRSIAQRGARIPDSCQLTNAIVAEGTILPPGLVIGEDIAADARWFRRTEGGTTLITPEMAARWREDHPSLFALSA